MFEKKNTTNIKINIADAIIPMYDEVLSDVLKHKHTHYCFAGGRGSTKSSFVGIAVPLLIVQFLLEFPDDLLRAVCGVPSIDARELKLEHQLGLEIPSLQ